MESFKDKIKKEAPLRMKEVTSKASSTNQGSLKGSHGKQQAKGLSVFFFFFFLAC